MKTKLSKQQLAQWLVDENNDCGKDTYFLNRLTDEPLTIEQSFKRFIKMTRGQLISTINDLSEDGQRFLEQNNLI